MSQAELLARGLTALGIDLPEGARERLLAYAALLTKWNKVYNLTAIRDPDEIVTHHLLDSLAVLPHLAEMSTLADVGSGGGLPGIPLAIARPELAVTSIETVNKKASFQQQAKIELGLANFEPRCARVEQVQPKIPFDAVISRAFSDLADFVRLAGHLIAPEATVAGPPQDSCSPPWGVAAERRGPMQGRLYAMKGVYPQGEIAALPPGWAVDKSIELQVPELPAERHLIVLKRNS